MKKRAILGPIPRIAVLAVPVFALRTKEGLGGGEFPDLVKTAAWARELGFARIKVLSAASRSSYNASDNPHAPDCLEALDASYLRLDDIPEVRNSRSPAAAKLRAQERDGSLPFLRSAKVDHRAVRLHKEAVLRAVFEELRGDDGLKGLDGMRYDDYRTFGRANREWLDEYASFRVLADFFGGRYWKSWPLEFHDPRSRAATDFLGRPEVKREIEFLEFMQWLIDDQYARAVKECGRLGVEIVDDMIFAPDRQSSNVYWHQDYYRFDCNVGEPPDQNLNLPPVVSRRVAEDYWSLLLRPLWAMSRRGLTGAGIVHGRGRFNPYLIPEGCRPEQGRREFPEPYAYIGITYGKTFFRLALETGLELIAENLGEKLYGVSETMEALDISELGVFRWARGEDDSFIDPRRYYPLGAMALSRHNTTVQAQYLKELVARPELAAEAGKLACFLGLDKLPPAVTDELHNAVPWRVAHGRSYQVIFQLGDVLTYDREYRDRSAEMTLNTPGTSNTLENKVNWVWAAPDLDEIFDGRTERAARIRDNVRSLMISAGRAAFEFVPPEVPLWLEKYLGQPA